MSLKEGARYKSPYEGGITGTLFHAMYWKFDTVFVWTFRDADDCFEFEFCFFKSFGMNKYNIWMYFVFLASEAGDCA